MFSPLNLIAYIDPMSGAVALQLIIAFVAGTAAFFRRHIIGGFKKVFGRSPNEPSV